ncbi:efflux RND transporter permease subunit [Sulfurovum sp. NBC37-1]|uniref:efflux RND transporter permease subunit n=1 Tax=Sulfurovum sp. (strain NBC37-1) TaxID=387093 RepID=UPI00015875DE|nr:efflux RND transporter permease subunit [Sulfurovum sp. NBC37-1]BAF71514.1 acriflavin resistance protein, AcrB/AcrD/AcrF family [Sulfurovum sp. NBC37-1]
MAEKNEYQVTDYAGKLAKGFLRNPLTAVLGVFLLLMGYLALNIMPREEDPQIAISGGAVVVAMPGATPREIENIIINPLERKLREVKGIEHIYGQAFNNYGVVSVMYYIGENREDSNLKLYDKVMQNMDLMPKGVMQPLIKPFDIDIDIPIVTVAFYPKKGSNVDDVKLFEMVRKIQQKINAVDNVAKTTLKGARRAQYNIEVDMSKLSAYHLSMGQIMKAVQSVAVDVPDVKGRTKNNELVIFGVKNAIESVQDVGSVIVAQYMGSPIYLRDVAKVTEGMDIQNFKTATVRFKEDANATKLGEERNQVTLTVAKLAGTNAVFVAEDVLEVLKEHEKEFAKEGIGYIITRNYGERANEAVNELMNHLIITIVIIALMLVFALGWKESLIVTFTVPAILAITLFVAYLSGQTINRITLFAFLLSLGLLVDAAIIVIENIHRHLHAHDVDEKEMDQLLIEATDEIGAPTNVATLAIILTMVPMAFVGGMMGSFMKPIPYNVPVALIASLFVAYIFTPYLSLKLLKKPVHKHHHHKKKHKDSKEVK